MRSYTPMEVISCSCKKILPLSGDSRPLIKFTRVVLPAPFEPINDNTSPCSTTKLTLSTARVSPKCFCNCSVRNKLTLRGSPHSIGQTTEQAHQARGHDQHQHHEHGTQHKLPVDSRTDGIGLEIIKHNSPENRSHKIPEAAEHSKKDNASGKRPDQNIRRRQAVQRHPEDTG